MAHKYMEAFVQLVTIVPQVQSELHSIIVRMEHTTRLMVAKILVPAYHVIQEKFVMELDCQHLMVFVHLDFIVSVGPSRICPLMELQEIFARPEVIALEILLFRTIVLPELTGIFTRRFDII